MDLPACRTSPGRVLPAPLPSPDRRPAKPPPAGPHRRPARRARPTGGQPMSTATNSARRRLAPRRATNPAASRAIPPRGAAPAFSASVTRAELRRDLRIFAASLPQSIAGQRAMALARLQSRGLPPTAANVAAAMHQAGHRGLRALALRMEYGTATLRDKNAPPPPKKTPTTKPRPSSHPPIPSARRATSKTFLP
jgi:hypothetical protein